VLIRAEGCPYTFKPCNSGGVDVSGVSLTVFESRAG
jgi:hypothetical protein